MTTDPSPSTPFGPAKKAATQPVAQAAVDRVEQAKKLLLSLTADERLKLQDETSLTIPEVYEGLDLTKRIFGYRCKGCAHVALEFLGDREPPMGVSFEHLPFVQDHDEYGSKPEWRRSQVKGKPRCMHCNRMLATEPGTNGIMDNRMIRNIEQYRSERKAQDQQNFWAHRRPNYRRDSAVGMGRPA